ncbi:MAG TPA: serine/threonine-protein kinase [Polyangiaceae bacterium]
MSDEHVQRRIGTTLRGKYLLEQVLGIGAMGAVFAATHRNGMRVAIKLLHPEMSRDEDVRRRFVREGYIANRVKHPGVVRIIDDDVDDDGVAFLVMELLEGCTLDAEWESSGRVAAERVGHVVVRLLDVLAAIHAEGIVHRDVKPENVFLTSDGGVKVLDLGIARVVESRTQTKIGILMGTPGFVAPEQALGNMPAIDARTDVFSVGALMFGLLTGEVIHPGATAMDQMVAAASQHARPLRQVWPEASPELANVVDVALAFDKTKRWPSALEMKSALEQAMAMRPASTLVEPETSVPFLLVRK